MKSFRTTDIYLAGYLRSLGLPLTSYERYHRNQRYYYSFRDSQELQTRIQDYRYGDAYVHPRVLRDNVRDIKGMVSSSKKSNAEV